MAVFLLSIVVFAGSCGGASKAPQEELPPNPYKGIAFRSIDELATAALRAIAHNDPEELNVLRVDQNEYRDVIWSRIPQTELANIDVATAWSWVQRDSEKAIGRALLDYGGRSLTLKRTIISKETRTFPAIRVVYGVLIVAVEANGAEHTIKLMNVVGEVDGYYRVIAFNS